MLSDVEWMMLLVDGRRKESVAVMTMGVGAATWYKLKPFFGDNPRHFSPSAAGKWPLVSMCTQPRNRSKVWLC